MSNNVLSADPRVMGRRRFGFLAIFSGSGVSKSLTPAYAKNASSFVSILAFGGKADLSQLIHNFLEDLAAMLIITEHIKTGARGREEHIAPGNGKAA